MYWYKFFFVTQSEKRGTLLLLFILTILLTARVVLAQYTTVPIAEQNSPIPKLYAQADSVKQASKTAKNTHFIAKNNPSIHAPKEDERVKSIQARKKEKSRTIVVELNSADTTQLKQLYGIGSGYANMIVNYRKKLGGFYHKEQLLEVYHFSRQTFQRIEAQLQVDTTQLVKIPLNSATIEQLKAHPYIRYFQAKSLVENRQARPHGRYNSLHDIVLDKDVTEAFLQKIAPYLSFQ
ncbi:MAG: helix-hairpin-helix domain-containing protein [Paludibacteraceae bacterium]|nr:helix-hairpin-helix domain-containing protein [Paludibacteraceae bacterium]